MSEPKDTTLRGFTAALRSGLPPRCATCAFTTGTVANLQDSTRIKAELCVLSGESFLCHEPDRSDAEGQVACVGWTQAVIKKAECGWYESQPAWRQELHLRMADLVTAHEDAILAGREYDWEAEMEKAFAEMDAKYAAGGAL